MEIRLTQDEARPELQECQPPFGEVFDLDEDLVAHWRSTKQAYREAHRKMMDAVQGTNYVD